MPYDALKTMTAYLTLWKALDVFFEGHHWLEIVSESSERSERELKVLWGLDFSFADNPKQLGGKCSGR